MTVLESIVKDLETLPASKLAEVANYVSRLNPEGGERRRRRNTVLRSLAGCMPGKEGEDFEKAVRAGADRIDADE
ncbi:MAG: hypothetical protein FWD53_10385 [Phycisphaerales bacterium]|nr:hypothetical protein [Phycisphaerales bacterium]